MGGRGRVDPGRLAAHKPAHARQGIRPDLALVHVDGHAPRFPLMLDVRQGLGEGLLGLRIGLGEALMRPLAPEPQQVQIPPRGGAGDGFPEATFDIGRDRVPRPGSALQAHPTWRTLHDVPQLGQFRRTEHRARLPAKLGKQAGEPMGIEALDPRFHGPSVAAQTLRHHLRGQPLGNAGQGDQALTQPGMGSRQTLAKQRRRTLPMVGGYLDGVHSGARWC